jgi:hypothetical protein
MVPKSQVATACLSCRPPDLNSSEFSSLDVKATKIYFSKFYFDDNPENQNPTLPLSQATAYNHHNLFIFTLPLSNDERKTPENLLTK